MTGEWPTAKYRAVELPELVDLCGAELGEAAAWCTQEGRRFEAGIVEWGKEIAGVLFVPSMGQAGVVFGSPLEWVRCGSAQEAFDRYLEGR